MYVYFDSNGNLLEIVNDSPIFEGDYNYDKIYVYWHNKPTNITNILKLFKWQEQGVSEWQTSQVETIETPTTVSKSIDYNAKRDLKYFEYNKPYEFYEIGFESIALTNGIAMCSLRFTLNDSSIRQLQLIPFMVSDGAIREETQITRTQYEYLLTQIGNQSVVSGTNDGTNWLTITINGTNRKIPTSVKSSYIISNTALTINDIKNAITEYEAVCEDIYGNDITQQVSSGEYDLYVQNSNFNSTNDSISANGFTTATDSAVQRFVIIKSTDLRDGDTIRLSNSNYPNRWFSGTNFISTNKYAIGYTPENVSNKISYTSTRPTDTDKYYNAQSIFDRLAEIMNRANGSEKVYILSYAEQVPTSELWSSKYYYRFDGTRIESYADFLTYIGSNITLANSIFNSDSKTVNVSSNLSYFLFRKVDASAGAVAGIIVVKYTDLINSLKLGDTILIEEEYINPTTTNAECPDRWYGGVFSGFYGYNGKVNLSSYQEKITAQNKLNIDFIDDSSSTTNHLMPKLPSSMGDGIYSLFAVKENGVVSYQWQVPTYDGGNE